MVHGVARAVDAFAGLDVDEEEVGADGRAEGGVRRTLTFAAEKDLGIVEKDIGGVEVDIVFGLDIRQLDHRVTKARHGVIGIIRKVCALSRRHTGNGVFRCFRGRIFHGETSLSLDLTIVHIIITFEYSREQPKSLEWSCKRSWFLFITTKIVKKPMFLLSKITKSRGVYTSQRLPKRRKEDAKPGRHPPKSM